MLMAHAWRTHPLAFPSILVATVAGILSPIVLLHNAVITPATALKAPIVYALGIFLIAMVYSLAHRAMRSDGLWLYACLGTFFYLAFSMQLVWAVAKIRDGAWGTRDPT